MSKSDALPSQKKWLAFFPPKFFMSLLLTPISDKLAFIMVGHRRRIIEESDSMNSLYDLSNDWRETIKMFRLGMICMLYVYSAYVRKYREQNNSFVDTKGLTRMLDRFIRKNP